MIVRDKDEYRTVKLQPAEVNDLVTTFASSSLTALSGRYDATRWTDQPENNLLLYGRKVPLFITVYGSLDKEDVRAKVPDAVLAAFDRLRRFSVVR
ncbi:MAG TPA: hypothetical protein VF695_06555, partial [Sphingomonas sp.]